MWKLNWCRQLMQPGEFHDFTGATLERLVPSGLPDVSIRWGAVIDERAHTDAGQVEGVRGGERMQDRARQAAACFELSCNEISKAYFYCKFLSPLPSSSVFFQEWLKPSFCCSQGLHVTRECGFLWKSRYSFRLEQFETIPGKMSHTLSAPTD